MRPQNPPPMYRSNTVPPDHMSADDRLAEVAGLLALALIRLRSETPAGDRADGGEGSLDCLAHQSARVQPKKGARP